MQNLLVTFTGKVTQGEIEIYNEFSLQHEFGIFLRTAQNNMKVQFEKNVSYFFKLTDHFIKKEIDLTIFSEPAPNTNKLSNAVEFKYPRNGQHPE